LSDALTGPKTAAVVLGFTGDSVLVVSDTVAFGVTAEIDGAPLAAPPLDPVRLARKAR